MHKKIFFKVIVIFLIMGTALAMTIGFSYVAIDTQKQHIAITEVVGAERMNMERFSLLTVNIGQNKIYNPSGQASDQNLRDIQGSVDTLLNLLDELNRGQYTLIDGSVTQLKLQGDFERLLMDKLDEIDHNFAKAQDLSKHILADVYRDDPQAYRDHLDAFMALNPILLELSDELVKLCLEEANVRRDFSLIMQSMSLVLALVALGLLIYYLVKDFYKPIMKMKAILTDLSHGDYSKRLVRQRTDEFASLFEDLNAFLNHLEDLMIFEDEILGESSIEKLLLYVEDHFKSFIPFHALGIVYKKDKHVHTIMSDHGRLSQASYATEDLEDIRMGLASKGHDEILMTPIEMNGITIGWTYFMIEHTRFEDHHRAYVELLEKKFSMAFYKSLLFHDLLGMVTTSLAKMAEKKDPETGNHLKRMALYTQIMARGLSKKEAYMDLVDETYVRNIYLTAPMHDIGKVAIKDDILLKPGKLTEQEFEVMKTHVTSGAEILEDVNQKFSDYNMTYFDMARDIACYHHEKFDGSGYPSQIKGKDIPLAARICAIADVFDALGSKRPYKAAFPLEKCYAILREGRGQHFDPEILDLFFDYQSDIEAVYHAYKEV